MLLNSHRIIPASLKLSVRLHAFTSLLRQSKPDLRALSVALGRQAISRLNANYFSTPISAILGQSVIISSSVCSI